MVSGMLHTRVHRLEQLSLKGMRSLSRDRTIVLLPVGMIEEHGDHLPLGTDNYGIDGLLLAAASWLLDSDDSLHVLLMPALPYGTDPIDKRRPELFTTAGSVWISPEALKAMVIDLAEHMVRYGFRFVFPVSFHAGAQQMVTLDDACAEMRARHPGLIMYEPSGYVMAGAGLDVTPGLATLLGRPLTTKEEVALRSSVHGSMFETSMMLHLQPDLVDISYRNLRTIEWAQMYNMKDWPGYVGAGPAHSNADVGGAVLRWRGVRAGALIQRAMEGEDLSALPRHPTWLDEPDTITEAPGEDELPRRPGPDSKPEIYISRAKLEEARSSLRPGRGGTESGIDLPEPAIPADETQPSTTNQTTTYDVPEDGEE